MDLNLLDRYNLRFKKTIRRWDEGIPLGNGGSGCLIWGTSRELRFSLNRGDIWDTRSYPGIYEADYSYATMVKLVQEGNVDEIRRIFDAPYNYAMPTKLPAGKLIFDFKCDAEVHSELILKHAEARVDIGQNIKMRSFLHAEQKVGMIQVKCPYHKFSFCIDNPEYGVEGIDQPETGTVNAVATASLKSLVYPAPLVVPEKYFVQELAEGSAYGVFTMVKESGDYVEIAYGVGTSGDGSDWKERAERLVEDALEKGYEIMLESHISWWENYWRKSSLSVPDARFEKNWYLTQYLLGSCSRKGCYPMALQGVWSADDGKLPPWKGDYHFDTNVEMCYYSYLKANHLEEGEAVIDFILNLVDCGRKFAQSYFHAKGICLPSTMSITGESLGGWGLYSMSPTNQLWICQMLERHYRFTGNQKFLKEKVYPYLKESAELILAIVEEKNGKYYLPISTSPEIHDDELEAYLLPNTNYDLSLMRYLFETLVKFSAELENGEEERWREALGCLPELAVNEKGVLMLCPNEELMESHRHFSHAMAIHPLRLLPYEGKRNRQIIDATVHDIERLGTGFWVGFSFAWMAEIYAVQKNGNGAAHQLELFWKHFCSPNGFHLNGDYRHSGASWLHYRPFTLEGNFCAADALQEMLLYTEDGVLQLFPAIPDDWMEEEVAFENFRGEKGLLISAVMKQGEVVLLTLKPGCTGDVSIKIDEKVKRLIGKMNPALPEDRDSLVLSLSAGKEYCFQI